LQFSSKGQQRLGYVVLGVCVFGPAAALVGHMFGEGAAAISAMVGALASLFALVWQGQAPQLEAIK
jgi:hypothetical protein